MRPQHQVVVFAQKQRDVRYSECILNKLANSAEQIFKVENRGSLLGDGVDRLELPGALLLQRVEARVLQSNGRLGGKEREQIDGLRVEMVHVVALTIQHAHYFIPNHQGDSEFGTGRLGGTDIARILDDVGSVNWLFLERCRSRDPLAHRPSNLVLPFIPANL